MTRICCLMLTLSLGTSVARAEIRVYDVDAAYRQDVYQVLSQLLAGGNLNFFPGRVALLPTGQMAVDTNEERHAEIETLLAALKRGDLAAAPSVSLRYWVLLGTPAAPNGNDRLPPLLESVAAELEAAHGDLDFRVIDSTTLVGAPDFTAVSQSETLEVSQRITPIGARIDAQINVATEYQELSVKVTLNGGEFLVLGEGVRQDEQGTRGVSAIVVHWPLGAD